MLGLNKLKEAKAPLLHVTKVLKKSNKYFSNRIKQLNAMIKERDFLASIAYDDEIEKLNPEKLTVSKNYDGPILE